MSCMPLYHNSCFFAKKIGKLFKVLHVSTFNKELSLKCLANDNHMLLEPLNPTWKLWFTFKKMDHDAPYNEDLCDR